MTTKGNSDEMRNRIKSLSESIFGGSGDLDIDEAEDLLRLAGCDPNALAADMYKRLYKDAQRYWNAGTTVPPLLKKALDDLRPPTEPPRNEKELEAQAQAKVESVVEQASAFPIWSQLSEVSFKAAAWRSKGELSEKDKNTLEEISKKLSAKLLGPGGSKA